MKLSTAEVRAIAIDGARAMIRREHGQGASPYRCGSCGGYLDSEFGGYRDHAIDCKAAAILREEGIEYPARGKQGPPTEAESEVRKLGRFLHDLHYGGMGSRFYLGADGVWHRTTAETSA